ncbi:hypothetical protein EON65_41895 [archaeon]|nr:MAG: hypothetical protein EON65_41895 [archaeon]
MLNNEGYCMNGNEHFKAEHRLATSISSGHTSSLQDFFKHCLGNNNRTIISSESFSTFHKDSQFAALKNFLSGHSYHIVAVYRDPLTLLQSSHSEVTKNAHGQVRSFRTYLTGFSTSYKNTFFFPSFDRYVKNFGRENVTILDYYGMAAAQRDIVKVLLCDVVDILCKERYPESPPVNVKVDTLPYELFEMVNNQLTSMGCKQGKHVTDHDQLLVIQGYREIAKRLPTRYLHLDMVTELARLVDAQIREKYGDIMLYNNRTASAEARTRAQVIEVDKVAFFSSRNWTRWMQTETENLLNRHMYGDCLLTLTPLHNSTR